MDCSADWRGDADRLAELGRRLLEGRFPVDRLALYRRSLHPEILGRATLWAPERPVEIFDRSHGLDLSAGFAGSPLDLAMAEGVSQRLQSAGFEHSGWQWAGPFSGLGIAELVIRPWRGNAALAAGTRRPSGFIQSEMELLDRLAGARRSFAGKAT